MQERKISLKVANHTFPRRRFTGRFLVAQMHAVRSANAPTGRVELWVGTDPNAPMVQARTNVVSAEHPQGEPIQVVIDADADNGAQDQIFYENPGYLHFELRYARDPYIDPNPNDASLSTNFLIPYWNMQS